MVSFSILNSHPVGHLKKEISKTNIKGYSKMKKGEIIDLMLKYPDRFKHIRTYGEPVKKIVIKRDNDIKPSMATKKIVIKRKPQQATVIKPKKREAKEAVVIKKELKKDSKYIKKYKEANSTELKEYDIKPSKATKKIVIKRKPQQAKVIKPKKRTALKAKVIKAQKDKQSSKSKDEESSEEEEEEEEITLRKFKPISVIPKALKKIWFEYMGVRAGSYTKEDQNDEVEELERVENNFIQANSNRKNKNLSSSEQMKGVFTIGQIIPEVIKEINDNPDLIKLYKVFQPSIIKNVLDQRKKTAENAKKEEAALKKQEKADKKAFEKSLKD